MVVCEFFFKPFHSRGSNDYLNKWAFEVDRLAADGWTVVECCRQREHPGFWTVVLGRPAQQVCCPDPNEDISENSPEEW